MRVEIIKNPNTYSCYSYYIRGAWNAIPDINTLIDVGTDDYVYNYIQDINAGVGKRKVDLVILTHEHFDHAAGLKYIVDAYNPVVVAYKKLPLVNTLCYSGMRIRIGDVDADVIHTPGHSHDSISIYIESEKAIFIGDTAYNIKTTGGTYDQDYVDALKLLNKLDIETIYSGHDDPVTKNAKSLLNQTLQNVLKSKII